ncbi:unnamed protein product [Phyllotreta striolata]|uniref:Coiled-coil-helix-coiled-coil-helix domain-containing protein 7 n=1 Tax=Phyllotreta striolata TaxID=444603 RepID=A0A9N9TNY5_PHYSR|nr:unnamed protein product [Phyllotreta striolata]
MLNNEASVKKQKMHDREAEEKNPCLKESNLTSKCFNDNDFDKSKCTVEIENYKLCKSFWFEVQKDRRRRGIKPFMPVLEERDSIKKEFFKKVHG